MTRDLSGVGDARLIAIAMAEARIVNRDLEGYSALVKDVRFGEVHNLLGGFLWLLDCVLKGEDIDVARALEFARRLVLADGDQTR